uniref:efflux RND transporter periplasmic adaptor subunit n=1 Tax=uncultured Dysgonomonas sp. TaxID=206096 RepID=UPI002583678E|nr:efflux RND transporter periplasmic adaptor subunit [uncultured Dysgonomonas sp.]
MIKKYIAAFVLIPYLLISCAQKEDNKTQQPEQAKEAFLKDVKTIPAALSTQDQELTLAGKVECDPDKMINYAPLMNGVVDRTYFSLGDKVQCGQGMLDMRSTELSSIHSENISLEADVKLAERELKTAQSMYNDGMLSEKELMEAQGKLKQAQAALGKVKADASVYGIRNSNGSFSIKAPISGYVTAKNVSSGTTVSEGSDPLFTIADLSSVWIVANVYAGNLQFVHEGMDVEITSMSYPGEVFYGKISSVPQIFDSEEKVLKARIVMQNKDLKFKPEMSVVVKLKNETQIKSIALPSDALIFDDNKYFVVVEEAEGKFVYKEVTLQGHNNKTSYISSGVAEGENVVIRNQLLIFSGLKGN